MFRLTADSALINRLGFNSLGALEVAGNLAAARRSIQIGVNVGKNRLTPIEAAADDYVRAVEALHRHADYFTVNVSSPNTEGLRTLQEAAALRSLVDRVVTHVKSVTGGRSVPVLAKFSPDSPLRDLLASVDAALEAGASGIIATNTTVSRNALASGAALRAETGGLSGAPLRAIANELCQQLFKHVGRTVPIVGVGGIFTAGDAYQRIRSGATLVQMYTGLIYEGPGAAARILRGVAAYLERDGFDNLADAVGVDVR